MLIEKYIPFRLQELCQKHEFSKYRLSQLTGISQTALGKILTGICTPTIPTLAKICDVFQISLAQFFAGEGTRPDLTDLQKEVLDVMDKLNEQERNILISFIRTLNKKEKDS